MGHPRPHLSGKAQTALGVAAEHRTGQTRLGTIGKLQSMLLVPGFLDAGNRPEDLFGTQLHIRRHITEYMGRKHLSTHIALKQYGSALRLGVCNLFLQAFKLGLVDRSEERRVGKECRSRGSSYHERKNAIDDRYR